MQYCHEGADVVSNNEKLDFSLEYRKDISDDIIPCSLHVHYTIYCAVILRWEYLVSLRCDVKIFLKKRSVHVMLLSTLFCT